MYHLTEFDNCQNNSMVVQMNIVKNSYEQNVVFSMSDW